MKDRDSGESRGFGFVTFETESSMNDAIDAMDGQDLGGRTIRVNPAGELSGSAPRAGGGSGGGGGGGDSGGGGGGSEGDVFRCYVGGLNFSTRERSLRSAFSEFGELLECTVVMERDDPERSRGFGFVACTFPQARARLKANQTLSHVARGSLSHTHTHSLSLSQSLSLCLASVYPCAETATWVSHSPSYVRTDGSREEMEEAVQSMNDEELDGRYITVNESNKKASGGGGMEAGGRGGGGRGRGRDGGRGGGRGGSRGGGRGGGGSAPVGAAPKGSKLSQRKLNAPLWCVLTTPGGGSSCQLTVAQLSGSMVDLTFHMVGLCLLCPLKCTGIRRMTSCFRR